MVVAAVAAATIPSGGGSGSLRRRRVFRPVPLEVRPPRPAYKNLVERLAFSVGFARAPLLYRNTATQQSGFSFCNFFFFFLCVFHVVPELNVCSDKKPLYNESLDI